MIGVLAPARKEGFNRPVAQIAAPAPERRPVWHLLVPLIAGLLVAETLGIVARE